MCIIIAKPAGVDLPTELILENCVTSNRDGIGFAFCKPGDRPIICKGFANIKKLVKIWDTFNVGKEHNLLVHFRLATHGLKDPGNCHPFPLTPDFEDMRDLHTVCDVAVTHNGVFGGMKASERYSDTMKFISTILASPEIIANLSSPSVQELVRGYCGFSSKLAFLKPEGISRIGEFEEDKGIFYSNAQYKKWGYHNNSYHDSDWRKGKEWCREHNTWDTCVADEKASGKSWCHKHKKSDYCDYCQEHEELDDCKHKASLASADCCKGGIRDTICNTCCPVVVPKKHSDCCGAANTDRTAVLDLRTMCEWCEAKDDVHFYEHISANMCKGCFKQFGAGYHD